jgi:uncharacterized repeat protein (TIGR01451 family)
MRLESRIVRWVSIVATVVISLLAASTGAAAATAALSVSLAATPDAEIYTATLANAGPDAATNVMLTATLPSGIIPISVTPSPACAFNLAGTPVTCSFGSIPNGGSVVVTIDIHPITIGTKTLSAQVSAAETDPNTADNSASASPTINGVGISDVQVTLFDVPDPIRVGQVLLYVAQVLNIQDDDAANVVVEVTIPPSVTFLAAASDRGACSVSGRRITCPIGSLSPSQISNAFVAVAPMTSGYIWASALASLTTPDPNDRNNASSARTWVNP